jgi:hypothetical protein
VNGDDQRVAPDTCELAEVVPFAPPASPSVGDPFE